MNKKLSVKIAVIIGIVLAMLILLTSISSTIYERELYQDQAKQSIANSWTGEQSIAGPILSLPFTRTWTIEKKAEDGSTFQKQLSEQDTLFFLPSHIALETELATDKRSKGIYSIPVFISHTRTNGYFSLKEIQLKKNLVKKTQEETIDWHTPFLSFAVKDARGIINQPSLEVRQTDGMTQNLEFQPGTRLKFFESGIYATFDKTLLLGKNEKFEFDFKLKLRGLESFRFVPSGKNISAKINSNWQHPNFNGHFLPVERSISSSGFSASWSVNSFASNINQTFKECLKGYCENFNKTTFGVDLIEPINIYSQSNRSLKYGILFICLIFAAFIIFEITHALPIHPVQYTLVGLGIAVFYLLLISISEHHSFELAYLIATLACSTLLTTYLKTVVKAWLLAIKFGVSISILFTCLFVIISSEDTALLMGSCLVFAALAAIMYATKNIDWYGADKPTDQETHNDTDVTQTGASSLDSPTTRKPRAKRDSWLD